MQLRSAAFIPSTFDLAGFYLMAMLCAFVVLHSACFKFRVQKYV